MELFFIVWMRWCVGAGGVGTKLRPKASTSASIGDTCGRRDF